jgi:hypothetical protein
MARQPWVAQADAEVCFVVAQDAVTAAASHASFRAFDSVSEGNKTPEGRR